MMEIKQKRGGGAIGRIEMSHYRLGLYDPMEPELPPRLLMSRVFSAEERQVMQMAIAKYNQKVSTRSDLELCVLAPFEIDG